MKEITKEEIESILEEINTSIVLEDVGTIDRIHKLYGKSAYRILAHHQNEYNDNDYNYSIGNIEVFDFNGKEIEIDLDDYKIWDKNDSIKDALDSISPLTECDVGDSYGRSDGIVTFYIGENKDKKQYKFFIEEIKN